jgi:Tol biopolymer transport system component
MSPDRTHVAFLDVDGIWVMGARGESPRRIVEKTKDDRLGGPTWSPDSSRIAYSLHRQTPRGQRATIQTIDVNANSPTTIELEGPGRNGVSRWAWLPDGRIVFSRPELVPYGMFNNLWVVRVDPHTGHQIGEARQLTDFPDFRFNRISASADANRLLFLRPVGVGAVLTGDLDDTHRNTGPLREITNDESRNRPVSWNADGSGLYILSHRGRSTSFYELQPASHSTNAVDAPTMEFAQLVAGGKELVYGVETPKRYSIYRRPLDGGPGEFVLNVEFELDFRCATLVEACVIVDNSGDKLRMSVFDVRTGERRDIATFPMTMTPAWSLSPDGTRLAVIGMEDASSNKIDLFDLASGKLLRKLDVQTKGPLMEISWAGPRAIIVSAGAETGGSDLLFIDMDGPQHLLWHDPRILGGITVSLDGRHVAASAVLNKVNAWLAENF